MPISIWQFGLYEGYEHVARLGFDGFGLGLLLITSFSSGYASPLQYIIVKTDFNSEEYLKIYKRSCTLVDILKCSRAALRYRCTSGKLKLKPKPHPS
jgi:hypothetical protein